MSTPTQFLKDIAPPKFNLPALAPRRDGRDKSRRNIFLHFCWDKSASFEHHAPAIEKFFTDFSDRAIKEDLTDSIQIAVTEMSGRVLSASYKPPGELALPNLKAGGMSPHASFLAEARKVDAPLIGAQKTALIRLIACDGETTDSKDDFEKEIEWLRKVQGEDDRFHVFTLQMGGKFRADILARLSLNRPNYETFEGNFSGLLDDLFKLIHGTIEDPTVPARSMSLRDIAPARFMERAE